MNDTIFYKNSEEITTLIQQFESRRLPRKNWTHAAHLTVACWYLLHHGESVATAYIRKGIKQYNASVGILNTLTTGYHETITLFWLQVIRHYLLNARPSSMVNLINQLLRSYSKSSLPLEYYSQDRLMSPEARLSWVEPDLKPLKFEIDLKLVHGG